VGQGGEAARDVGAAEPAERVEAMSMASLMPGLNWSTGQVEMFLAGVRNYLTKRAVHSYMDACSSPPCRQAICPEGLLTVHSAWCSTAVSPDQPVTLSLGNKR
jgi:hypothetical protein